MDNTTKNQVQQKMQQYFDDLSVNMKESLGFELDAVEKQAIYQFASNLEYDDNLIIGKLITLLEEIGLTQSEIEDVVDQLNSIVALRLLIKIFTVIPKDKRDSIEKFSTQLDPVQFNKMIETVFENESGGEKLEDIVKSYQDDTFEAYYKDVLALWDDTMSTKTPDDDESTLNVELPAGA